MSRRGLAALVALALLFGVAGAARAARVHPPPRLWVEIRIEDHGVRLELSGAWDLLRQWCPGPRFDDSQGPLAEDEVQAILRAAQSGLADLLALEVDGSPRPVEVVGFRNSRDIEGSHGYPIALLEFHAATEGPPRRVGLRWLRFDGLATEDSPSSEFQGFVRFGARGELVSFSEAEPEFVWHQPAAPAEQLEEVYGSAQLLPPEPRPRSPLGPALVFGSGLSLGLCLRRRRMLAASAVFTGLCAAAAWWMRPLPPVPVQAPSSEEEAFALFAPLHGNVFRAFDQADEDSIYAVLSASVDESVLDELYAQVFESLLLRDEGGASATVEAMEVVDRSWGGREEGPPPRFTVDWSWRAQLCVRHFGHAHRRINEHWTEYTLRHDGRRWKIHGWRVLDSRRLTEEESAAAPLGGG